MKLPPMCRGCGCRVGPFVVGKVVKVIRVAGGLRPVAWVRCRRQIMPATGGGWICGWSWWSLHPDMVARAKQQKGFRLVRARKARAVARQDRKGKRPYVR